jgi:hypothetical protein
MPRISPALNPGYGFRRIGIFRPADVPPGFLRPIAAAD